MAGFKGKLTRRQEEAIAALLSTRGVDEAAKACNTPVRTLYRWLSEPEFDAAYRAARRKAFGQCTARLQHAASAAATTLVKVLLDAGTPASTRVRAAECIISHASKAMEIEDVEARVTALEQGAELSKQNRHSGNHPLALRRLAGYMAGRMEQIQASLSIPQGQGNPFRDRWSGRREAVQKVRQHTREGVSNEVLM
jgi:hypothetical protein